jgi:hypothetical protein
MRLTSSPAHPAHPAHPVRGGDLDDERRSGVSRRGLLARTAAGFGAVSAAGAAAVGLAGAFGAAPPTGQDSQALALALSLEQLQVAFYAQALEAGRLSGEPRQFAEIVAAQERAHLSYLTRAAGSSPAPAPRYRFGAALTDSASFVAAAVSIEETALAAYNGQATNLSPAVLAEVGRVISVEARHAAWARTMAGRQPAPVAVDVPISAAQARAAMQRFVA